MLGQIGKGILENNLEQCTTTIYEIHFVLFLVFNDNMDCHIKKREREKKKKKKKKKKKQGKSIPSNFYFLNFQRNEYENFGVQIAKGKAIPLQAWTGPEGSRRLRLPDF